MATIELPETQVKILPRYFSNPLHRRSHVNDSTVMALAEVLQKPLDEFVKLLQTLTALANALTDKVSKS